MSYEVTYIDSGKGICKCGRDVVSAAEVIQGCRDQARDEVACRKLHYGIVDFSQVTDLRMTTSDIRHLVEANRKTADLTPGMNWAIVATGPLAYGMSRMWQTFASDLGWQANVFHAMPEAKAWLRKQLAGADGSVDVLAEYPSLGEE